MNPVWMCGVCETVNHGGQTCAACGAAMTRRSAAMTAVRGRLAPVPPPEPPAPLPEPVRRAINREPVAEDEWPYEENSFRMIPVPGGCLFISAPRRRTR
jgi:anti-sigma factor RsiW